MLYDRTVCIWREWEEKKWRKKGSFDVLTAYLGGKWNGRKTFLVGVESDFVFSLEWIEIEYHFSLAAQFIGILCGWFVVQVRFTQTNKKITSIFILSSTVYWKLSVFDKWNNVGYMNILKFTSYTTS